jgi:hypothetical protein
VGVEFSDSKSFATAQEFVSVICFSFLLAKEQEVRRERRIQKINIFFIVIFIK